ncbi:DUF3987 domain-containing protein [uncultured Desulfosarcina sp.]|uniref:DUF3987 domain-containing protein n=1 Tax=uncultured Desulfosarcina sp. TaxID=218289 RepID=UPI0029C633BA|nr:DUF3987 domain-containing protein [uncultured Desulfosarcina sp.]
MKQETGEMKRELGEKSENTRTNNKIKLIHEFTEDSSRRKMVEETELTEEECGLVGWPTLKEEALYGYAGRFVKAATENSEADPAAVLLTLLTRFGVECGPDRYLMVGDSKHHPRIFSVIVGASSKARKGTSGKPVQRLFSFDSEEFDLYSDRSDCWYPSRSSPGPLSSGEGIVHAVRDPREEWNAKKRIQELVDPGIDDKRLFIQDEEFASALSCMKREGNTLSTILRCAWDNGTIDILTKSAKTKTTNAHIGINSHITSRELHKKLNETEAFNGFANRFLFCCARRSKIVPFPRKIDEKEFTLLRNQIAEILSEVHEFDEIILSTETMSLWEEVYPALTKDHAGLVGAVVNRAEAQVLRLAMLYALLDRTNVIEPVHLRAALAVWDYCHASARFIFGNRESNPYSRRIMAAVKAGPKSMTDLHSLFNRQLSKADLDEAVQELIAQGTVELVKEKTNGRPKTTIKLVEQSQRSTQSSDKSRLNTDY